jgi:hypothetical protein
MESRKGALEALKDPNVYIWRFLPKRHSMQVTQWRFRRHALAFLLRACTGPSDNSGLSNGSGFLVGTLARQPCSPKRSRKSPPEQPAEEQQTQPTQATPADINDLHQTLAPLRQLGDKLDRKSNQAVTPPATPQHDTDAASPIPAASNARAFAIWHNRKKRNRAELFRLYFFYFLQLHQLIERQFSEVGSSTLSIRRLDSRPSMVWLSATGEYSARRQWTGGPPYPGFTSKSKTNVRGCTKATSWDSGHASALIVGVSGHLKFTVVDSHQNSCDFNPAFLLRRKLRLSAFEKHARRQLNNHAATFTVR